MLRRAFAIVVLFACMAALAWAQPRNAGQPFSSAIFVSGNPNGRITATKGTIGIDYVSGTAYQNTNGRTAWSTLLTAMGGGTGTVTGTGTANTLAKFTSATAVGNATGVTQTTSGTLDIAGGSGVTSLSVASTNADGIIATRTATNETTDGKSAVYGIVSGTFDTTGVEKYAYGTRGDSIATRGAGANVLNNWGSWGRAAGGQKNIGVLGWVTANAANTDDAGVLGLSDSGAPSAYGVKGNARGAATINYGVYSDASGGGTNYSGYFNLGAFRVVGAAQFDSTLNSTGNLSEATVRVLTLAGTGLSKSGGTVSLNMAGASCTGVNVMTALGATGTGTCASPPTFTSVANGYAPLSGGGTTNFLRADGTWTTPGGGISGLTTNYVTKASSATAIANSSIKEDGTSWTLNTTAGGSTAKVTMTLASGNIATDGSVVVNNAAGASGDLTVKKQTSGTAFGVTASTGNTTVGGTLDVAGTFTVANNILSDLKGTLKVTGGTISGSGSAPTLTGCGTSPSISAQSSNLGGTLTTGASGSSSCVITYTKTFDAAPWCLVYSQTDGSMVNPTLYTRTTTALTIPFPGTSRVMYYVCAPGVP